MQDYKFKIGKAHVFNEGKDAAIIATGLMVAEALKARDLLKAEGIDAGVINMSTIKPLDAEAVIAAAKRCGAIVTAEEHSIIGGLGGAVAEVLSESPPVPLVRIGVKDTFGTSGDERRAAEALRPVGGGYRCGGQGSDQEETLIRIANDRRMRVNAKIAQCPNHGLSCIMDAFVWHSCIRVL